MSTTDILFRVVLVLGCAYCIWYTFEVWFRPEKFMDRMERSIWGEVDKDGHAYVTDLRWWRSKTFFRAVATFMDVIMFLMLYAVFIRR